MKHSVYINRTTNVDNLVCEGPSTQTDATLLASFLPKSKSQSRLQRAQTILSKVPLSRFYSESGISCLMEAGMSERQLAMITAGMELARRSVERQMINTDVMSSPELVRTYLQLRHTASEHKVFSVLLLDNRHRVIDYTEMFQGTIDTAAVYPREIVKKCLRENAAAVIFCHNHPSGQAEPSDTDVRLTRKLIDALALIDVRVLDHLIIGKGTSTSMAERGLM